LTSSYLRDRNFDLPAVALAMKVALSSTRAVGMAIAQLRRAELVERLGVGGDLRLAEGLDALRHDGVVGR